MIPPADSTSPFYSFSLKALHYSSEAFRAGDKERGFETFKCVFPAFQYKVYKQLWIDKGSPEGCFEYGRDAFHDENGYSSTVAEKAVAIDKLREIHYTWRHPYECTWTGH